MLHKKHGIAIMGTLLLAAMFVAGSSYAQNTAAGSMKVGEHGIVHKGMKTVEHPVTPTPIEQKKKEVAERLDKFKLLYTGKVVVDSDPQMLVPIESVAKFAGKDFVIAKTPPTVEFCVVPVEPMWLGESPVKSQSSITNQAGPWSNWCQANFDSRTGKFYSAVGDHG
jgi:hypothetical protein